MRTFGLFLLAVGAILTFATNFWLDGVNLTAVGVILMVVGGLGILFGSIGGASTKVERQVSDDGRSVVENRRTSSV